MVIDKSNGLEVLDEIERLARATRDLIVSPPTAKVDRMEIPEPDRAEVHRSRIVFALLRIRRLAGTLAVRISEEPR